MNRADLPQPNATCEVCGRKYRRCKKCIELKQRGIETWREHCDSIECYQTLVFANTKDVSNLTLEDYNNVIALELPDGNRPVKEIQEKLNAIKKAIIEKDRVNKVNKEEKKSTYKGNKYNNTINKNVK